VSVELSTHNDTHLHIHSLTHLQQIRTLTLTHKFCDKKAFQIDDSHNDRHQTCCYNVAATATRTISKCRQ